MNPPSPKVCVVNLASHQGVREETEKCTKGNGETNAGYNMEKRALWIREETKVEDILMTIKNKKWTWAGHIMCRRDKRWTTRVTEWQPRNGRRNQGRQRVRSRDEIRAFAGPSWSSLTSDRSGECWERPLSCSGLAMAEYDDDEYDIHKAFSVEGFHS